MRNLLFFFGVVFIGLFTAPHSQANIKIGNGGEGLEIGGQLRLRDFVDSQGIYHLPIRVGAHSQNDDLPLWTPSGMELDTSLLARELERIKNASPSLAQAVIETIRGCWVAVESDLWLPNSLDNRGAENRSRAPIAVRGFPFLSCTTINKTMWMRLSEIDKIGLIVHEAVSSLLKPSCNFEWCGQDAEAVRNIVYMIFHMDQDKLGVQLKKWQKFLNLGRHESAGAKELERIQVRLSLRRQPKNFITEFSDSIALGPQLISIIPKICEQAMGATIEITAVRSAQCTYREVIKTRGHEQMLIRPGRRLGTRTFVIREVSFEDCQARLSDELGQWFGTLVPLAKDCS